MEQTRNRMTWPCGCKLTIESVIAKAEGKP